MSHSRCMAVISTARLSMWSVSRAMKWIKPAFQLYHILPLECPSPGIRLHACDHHQLTSTKVCTTSLIMLMGYAQAIGVVMVEIAVSSLVIAHARHVRHPRADGLHHLHEQISFLPRGRNSTSGHTVLEARTT
jgi:hypothetical protein